MQLKFKWQTKSLLIILLTAASKLFAIFVKYGNVKLDCVEQCSFYINYFERTQVVSYQNSIPAAFRIERIYIEEFDTSHTLSPQRILE